MADQRRRCASFGEDREICATRCYIVIRSLGDGGFHQPTDGSDGKARIFMIQAASVAEDYMLGLGTFAMTPIYVRPRTKW